MDELKEKLITMIQEAVGGCARHWAELIADHLIANGVTVANGKDTDVPTKHGEVKGVEIDPFNKWIPVTEKLPEHFEAVLLWESNEEDVYTGELDGNDEWFIAGFPFENFTFTHWMPLPGPPK